MVFDYIELLYNVLKLIWEIFKAQNICKSFFRQYIRHETGLNDAVQQYNNTIVCDRHWYWPIHKSRSYGAPVYQPYYRNLKWPLFITSPCHNFSTNNSRDTRESIFLRFSKMIQSIYVLLKIVLGAKELRQTSQIRAYYFICFNSQFPAGTKDFFKGFINHLHVTFGILIILYFFCTFCIGRANRLYVWWALLYPEFEQFGSLHKCAPRKNLASAGLEPGTPSMYTYIPNIKHFLFWL